MWRLNYRNTTDISRDWICPLHAGGLRNGHREQHTAGYEHLDAPLTHASAMYRSTMAFPNLHLAPTQQVGQGGDVLDVAEVVDHLQAFFDLSVAQRRVRHQRAVLGVDVGPVDAADA